MPNSYTFFRALKILSFRKMLALFVLSSMLLIGANGDDFDEENYGVKYANDCEVCKIVSKEFVTLLKESEGKSEVLETGYSVQVIPLHNLVNATVMPRSRLNNMA